MFTDEAPEWMRRGKAGTRSLPDSAFSDWIGDDSNEQLNLVKVRPEDTERLGAEAKARVTWPLSSEPFAVQAVALDVCGQSRYFGWFLEQGLGKTQLAWADFWNRYTDGINDCGVIVTVNSMKLTWRREALDHGLPIDVYIWPSKHIPDDLKGAVVVINYEALRGKPRRPSRAMKWLMRQFPRLKPYLVFDESTSIKTHTAQQTDAALSLARAAHSVRLLAGKPNPNGPHDLWTQLKALQVEGIGEFRPFKTRYTVSGGGQFAPTIGVKRVDELAELMHGKVWFADKPTWAPTLPPKMWATRDIELTDAQEEAYRTMARQLYVEIEEGRVSIENALHRTTKLQQISMGYVLGPDGKAHDLLGRKKNPKIEALRDYLDTTDGKTVVFAHYQESMRRIREAFPDAAYALGTSSMKAEERERQKARFNDSDDCNLFIAPISVMQYGHTLIGNKDRPCKAVWFLENTFSLLARTQAEDRAHRWGLKSDQMTYYDMVASSVDKAVCKRLQEKASLADGLLNALKGFVTYGR